MRRRARPQSLGAPILAPIFSRLFRPNCRALVARPGRSPWSREERPGREKRRATRARPLALVDDPARPLARPGRWPAPWSMIRRGLPCALVALLLSWSMIRRRRASDQGETIEE